MGKHTEYNEVIHEEVTYRLKVFINHVSFLFFANRSVFTDDLGWQLLFETDSCAILRPL